MGGMSASLLPQWSGIKPVIGMVHLMALPGSPRFAGDLRAICDAALRDAEALAAGGVHGIMMENFGDAPFYPGRVPASVVAHVTAIAAEIRRAIPDVPLGINVLRNDGQSALAVAHAVGASFIRVNVLCGARVTDQGVIQGIAHDLLRERAHLGAHDIKIMADVDVKHSAPLAARPIVDEVDDTIERGLADAVIITGAETGAAADPTSLRLLREAIPDAPLIVGSGLTRENAHRFDEADAAIVGTSLKGEDGRVEASRVKALARAFKSGV
jgi:membrane complex biogenesis BtpA family protein